MTIDTQKLRELHRAITPLPWTVAETAFDNEGCPESVIRGMQGRAGVAVTIDFGKNNPGMREANAAYLVAACNAQPALLDQIDAQAAEIDHLKARLDRHTAYCITHKGALRYCNSSMRDAYSDEQVRADAAEAEVERLRAALSLALEYWADRMQRYKNRSPVWVQKARAALQGESKC